MIVPGVTMKEALEAFRRFGEAIRELNEVLASNDDDETNDSDPVVSPLDHARSEDQRLPAPRPD